MFLWCIIFVLEIVWTKGYAIYVFFKPTEIQEPPQIVNLGVSAADAYLVFRTRLRYEILAVLDTGAKSPAQLAHITSCNTRVKEYILVDMVQTMWHLNEINAEAGGLYTRYKP